MARFNEILTGRHNRLLQKLFSMKGGPPAPQLASEITASVPLFHGAENRYLESWERFGIGSQVAALAANNDVARLRNPAGSNVIAVIEKLQFTNSLADTLTLEQGVQAADATTPVVATRLDPRQRPNPTCIFSVANGGATFGTAIGRVGALAAGASFDIILFEALLYGSARLPILRSSKRNDRTILLRLRQALDQSGGRTGRRRSRWRWGDRLPDQRPARAWRGSRAGGCSLSPVRVCGDLPRWRRRSRRSRPAILSR